jgi:hypothetical protein
MAFTVSQKTKNKSPLIPADTYQAICYYLVDIGTQTVIFSNKPKKVHQIYIGWELPEVRIELERDGKTVSLPRAISKKYGMSLHKKATLYKDLTSWRGQAFTKEELDGFDLKSILGVNCLLQIVHETSESSGETYANVGGVSKLLKSIPLVKAENPLVSYSMEENGLVIPEGVPDWLKDKIKQSDEWLANESPAAHEPEAIDIEESDQLGNNDVTPF